MVLLRVASLVVVSIWVGGLAVLGFVAAPMIFSTLEAHDPATGRALAGLVFGVVFERFQYWAWLLGGLSMALLLARALLGPRPNRLARRLWLVAGMLALSVVTSRYIAPEIDRIRQDTAGNVSSLPETDPRRAEFGRLHGLSNIFMLATLIGGVGLIWMEADEKH
jgi:hypothetical protein